MISIELTQQLESRVKKVMELVRNLREENQTLKDHIASIESELDGLRRSSSDRKNNEEQLEAGLKGVLDILAEVEEDAQPANPPPSSEAAPTNDLAETSNNDNQTEYSSEDPTLGDWQTFSDPTASEDDQTEPDGSTETDPDSEWVNSLDETMVNIPPPSSETSDEAMNNSDTEQDELNIF